MDAPRMLPGSELVARGVTKKYEGQLPHLGLKDVSPNGSWLEQKQIQSALEARKHLIEVERIEKIGSLSQAIWRDDLNLAEITQKVGGHWQYLGHNVGKHLFLRPEETVFLIEVNCLLLKHNDVIVSLQKAYSLCLGEIAITQYKCYASLSRLGYRVLRHRQITQPKDSKCKGTKQEEKELKRDEVQGNNIIDMENINNSMNSELLDNSVVNGNQSTEIERSKKVNLEHEASKNITIEEHTNDRINKIASEIITDLELRSCESNSSSKIEIANANPNKSFDKANSTLTNENKDGIDESKSVSDSKPSKIEEAKMPNVITPINEVSAILVYSQDVVITSENENNINHENETTMHVDDNANETNLSSEVVNMTEESTYDETGTSNTESSGVLFSVDDGGVIRVLERNVAMEPEVSTCDDDIYNAAKPCTKDDADTNHSIYDNDIKYYQTKMEDLMKKKSIADQRNLEGLNAIQDCYQQNIIRIKAPDKRYLPGNIVLPKNSYTLNMDTVRNQNATNANVLDQSEEQTPSSRNANVPLLGLPRYNLNPPYNPRYSNYRFTRQEWMYRPSNYFYNYNLFRPTMPYFASPRFRFQPHRFVRQMNYQNPFETKRQAIKMNHFNTIVNIANRFRSLTPTHQQIQALHRILATYNAHYGENFEVTQNFELRHAANRKAESAREVIVLDDDEPQRKKQRTDDDNQSSNLEKLKALAAKLKDLQAKNVAMSRHRRVFSNAIKSFNKSYNADIYLDSNFEIKDRKLIVLDESSDSDVMSIQETDKPRKRKRYRNPYNILKHGRINESKNLNEASTSREVPVLQKLTLNMINGTAANNTSDSETPELNGLLKYFDKAWIPSDDDFGRPEICSREKARLDAVFETGYMNDFLEECSTEFAHWFDVKIAILRDIQGSLDLQREQAQALSNDFLMETETLVQPIVKHDCTDLRSALKQLAIIPSCKEVSNETSLRIDFDVWNRQVQFKKTDPPKPDFRVICLDESAPFPSGEDIAALHAKYCDGIPAVFAFIGTDSVSYLQVNAIDLPVYISDNDLT